MNMAGMVPKNSTEDKYDSYAANGTHIRRLLVCISGKWLTKNLSMFPDIIS